MGACVLSSEKCEIQQFESFKCLLTLKSRELLRKHKKSYTLNGVSSNNQPCQGGMIFQRLGNFRCLHHSPCLLFPRNKTVEVQNTHVYTRAHTHMDKWISSRTMVKNFLPLSFDAHLVGGRVGPILRALLLFRNWSGISEINQLNAQNLLL